MQVDVCRPLMRWEFFNKHSKKYGRNYNVVLLVAINVITELVPLVLLLLILQLLEANLIKRHCY